MMSWDPFREGDLILDQGMRWSVHTYSIHEGEESAEKKHLKFELWDLYQGMKRSLFPFYPQTFQVQW